MVPLPRYFTYRRSANRQYVQKMRPSVMPHKTSIPNERMDVSVTPKFMSHVVPVITVLPEMLLLSPALPDGTKLYVPPLNSLNISI